MALEAARKSLVLLKNDGPMLPLDRTGIRTLAVVGVAGAHISLMRRAPLAHRAELVERPGKLCHAAHEDRLGDFEAETSRG